MELLNEIISVFIFKLLLIFVASTLIYSKLDKLQI